MSAMDVEHAEQGEAPSGDEPARRIVRTRRTTGLVIVAVILVVTTVGAVVFGIYEYNRAERRARRAAELQTELAMTGAQLAQAQEDRDAAAAGSTDRDQTIASLQDQLGAASAERDALAALFPLDAATLAAAGVEGSYQLALEPVADACTGFSDTAATCVVANFPTDLVLIGNQTDGVRAASSWFDTISLAADGGAWTGSGTVYDTVSNTCSGAPIPTSVQLTVAVGAAAPTADRTGLQAQTVTGRITLASTATDQCVDASRAATFLATPTG